MSPKKILLAEDNPGDVLLVREALRFIECELQVLTDGGEAVAFINRLDADSKIPCPDLLLLDLNLPKYGGREILKCLRASERCGQTPVVILTSSDSMDDQAIAERHATIHYFRKPSSLDQYMALGEVVKDALARG